MSNMHLGKPGKSLEVVNIEKEEKPTGLFDKTLYFKRTDKKQEENEEEYHKYNYELNQYIEEKEDKIVVNDIDNMLLITLPAEEIKSSEVENINVFDLLVPVVEGSGESKYVMDSHGFWIKYE